jgi:hypothetical protein
MRSTSVSLFAVSVVCGAVVAAGCGSGSGQSTTLNTSSSDALSAVENCQDQEHGCFTDGGGETCADALRACLMSVVPSGGSSSGHPGSGSSAGSGNGGSAPSNPPGLDDGGNPKAADPDVGDGGAPPARPALPDAAVAALTKPIGGDSGSDALPCVEALRSCLATAARPEACADQARTCLMAAHDGGRPGAAGDH